MSAISAACAPPNSRSAQSRVNSPIFSLGQRFGLRAKFRKKSMGSSIGFRSPTFTIQTRSAPYSDRKSTRLNSSHLVISYAVFCLKKKKKNKEYQPYCQELVRIQSLGRPSHC